MRQTTTPRSRRGYIIQEIIIGVVVFGIAMLPIVRALQLLPNVSAAVGEQSRREAWRSASDEAVLRGVDPRQTSVMNAVTDAQATEAMLGDISRVDLPGRAGGAQITVLSSAFSATAEDRAVPAGFEIGAGTLPTPPREDPLPPLPVIKLTAPRLSEASGAFVSIFSLAPGATPNDPYLWDLGAVGAPSDVVRITETAPTVQSAEGLGAATLRLNAVELARNVGGSAWAEYHGDPSVDIPVSVGDRTRWLVRVGPRTQVYEPSDPITFTFGLDIGRPAYAVAGVEHPSGESVPVDYATALTIDAGRAEAALTYPAEVRQRFGSEWSAVAPSFSWTFGRYAGDSSAGNTVSFFRPAGRLLWQDSQTLVAQPLSTLSGLRPLIGTWSVERQVTTLQPPERLAGFYDGETDEPSWVEFGSPTLLSLGRRVGRPEVNGVESVNENLSVLVVP